MTGAGSTGGTRRFLFGDDFRAPTPRDDPAGRAREAAERARLDQAAADALARGREAGRREAEAETSRRLADTLGRLADAAGAAVAGLDARAGQTEEEGLAFFRLLATRLAGEALKAEPLGLVAEAAREAFRHLRGIPHLVARVHPDLVERVDELLRRMARERGFEGRIVVIADEDLSPADARLDWADGGVVRDHRAIEDAVAAVLAPLSPSTSPHGISS